MILLCTFRRNKIFSFNAKNLFDRRKTTHKWFSLWLKQRYFWYFSDIPCFALSSIYNDNKMKLLCFPERRLKSIRIRTQHARWCCKLVISLFVCYNCAQTPLIGVSVSRVSQSERDRTTLVPGSNSATHQKWKGTDTEIMHFTEWYLLPLSLLFQLVVKCWGFTSKTLFPLFYSGRAQWDSEIITAMK